MFCAENLELGEVDIKRDIFQSPLVFLLALIPLGLESSR